ncbi:MAG TPA: glycosyltransferase, partial [Verrucomicrobiae bacterium]|nr:glycosyltransferase [Verrucomicrobiae bacterium]
MKISIIIPAFNEQKLLPATLESVFTAAHAVAARQWQYEIIVCDNNSTDRTAEIASARGAHVVFEPVNQIGRARNRGASVATGDWLIFIDADSHPGRPLLEDVCNAIAEGRYIAGGCTVKLDARDRIGELLTEAWNLISRVRKWAAGSFIFCEASAFREVGGFSAELFASEEVELFQRLHKLARRRRRKIVILHKHPLITSARKAHLYSKWEHLRFFLRTALSLGGTLR